MPKIESRIGKSQYPIEQVYEFIADFRNFKELAQAKLNDFEATQDTCSFTIPSLGKGDLEIIDRDTLKTVKIEGRGISNSRFTLWIQTKEAKEQGTNVKITMEPQLNPMLMTMVKSHLQKFVDMLVEQIETYEFNPQNKNS